MTPELVELRRVGAQIKAIDKWNGVLPQVSSGAVPFIQVPRGTPGALTASGRALVRLGGCGENRRGRRSRPFLRIAWPDYHGSLKFVAK